MAKNTKKRHRLSGKAVEQRRQQVLELRLAGLSPASIAEELRKTDLFKHTTVDTVWNDVKALREKAELEPVERGRIVREAYQKSRDSTALLSKAAHLRFKDIGDQIGRTQEDIARVDEAIESREPHQDSEELFFRRHELIELARQLRDEARAETRSILSINDKLVDMPRRLGILLERKEVGLDEGVLKKNERLIEAIRDERDQDKKEALIQAAELLATVVP